MTYLGGMDSINLTTEENSSSLYNCLTTNAMMREFGSTVFIKLTRVSTDSLSGTSLLIEERACGGGRG